jgi:hypothetical protein
MGPVSARVRQDDGRLETLHSGESGGEYSRERHRRRSADAGSLAAAEAVRSVLRPSNAIPQL